MNILIVEDEILIAQTLKLYLEERGHTTQEFCISYEEAIASYRKEVPDLVLLDIRLYGKRSGLEVAKFLSEQPEQVPFVYLTSQQEQSTFRQALETTPYGYLPKPIRKDSLWTTIETAYRLAASRQKPSHLVLSESGENHKILTSDILYVEAEHVYTCVYLTNGQEITTRKSLNWLLAQTPALVQTHRSYLVNIASVKSWTQDELVLLNGEKVPVSRSRKKAVQEQLGK